MLISLREARKIFSPSLFSYQDGLSWHLRALYCKLETPAPKKQGDIAKISWDSTVQSVVWGGGSAPLLLKVGGLKPPLPPLYLRPDHEAESLTMHIDLYIIG